MKDFLSSTNDVEPGLHEFGCFNKAEFISILNAEFERLFGHTGLLMVEKVLQNYKDRDQICSYDMPIIIELLVASVEDIMTTTAARDLRRRLKDRCGLPVMN